MEIVLGSPAGAKQKQVVLVTGKGIMFGLGCHVSGQVWTNVALGLTAATRAGTIR